MYGTSQANQKIMTETGLKMILHTHYPTHPTVFSQHESLKNVGVKIKGILILTVKLKVMVLSTQ